MKTELEQLQNISNKLHGLNIHNMAEDITAIIDSIRGPKIDLLTKEVDSIIKELQKNTMLISMDRIKLLKRIEEINNLLARGR